MKLCRLALVLLTLSGISGCGPRPAFDNLIVIVVDALRSDHLPSYGYSRDTAPYLARLAGEGIQLQGYSVSSWTKPSVASLLTGLSPQRHQAISRSDHLPAAAPYLPEILRKAGFDTAAYVGNLNVGREWSFNRGYRVFLQPNGTQKVDGQRVTGSLLAGTKDLERRFFLYVHYVDPHDPYVPRKPWTAGRYVQPRQIERGRFPMNDATLQQLRDQYDGEIAEADREIEHLLAALRKRGLLKRTLVVVTADHGEEFGEHGGLTHGHTLYEEVLRVPFLLWSEEGLPRCRSGERFYQLDFLPTMLTALGEKVPEKLDGRSNWKEMLENRTLSQPLYFHLDLDRKGALAVLDFPRKLIHGIQEPVNRLYDLEADPREQSPRAESGGELLAGLLLQHNRRGQQAFERRTSDVHGKLRESLAALGYLRSETPDAELRERVIPPRLDPRLGLANLPPERRH
jgi:choline-sulfatase